MNRLRAASPAFVLFFCACVVASGQALPEFEVVSIRPVPRPTPDSVQAGTSRVGLEITADRVQIGSHAPTMLVARAFEVETLQVDAGAFNGTQFFDIQAKLPAGATPAQVPAMLQSMLQDRFKLAYHREMREYPGTVVIVGKNGMKLQRLPDGTVESSKSEKLANGTTRFTLVGPVSSWFSSMRASGGFPQLVDETGLEGMYTWVRDQLPAADGISYRDRVRESFEAMIDAAGLKLEARKVPMETIVIDHLEALPTEN